VLEAEFSRVMAQHDDLKRQIAVLKKMLLREIVRHRNAHRYTAAKDIEVSLLHLGD
jgi:hypothetical protein